jgi:hypothetical protein
MPLGDLSSTFLTLLVAHPQLDWTFLYRVTDRNKASRDFLFESAELQDQLGDIPLTEPEVLAFVRGMIEEGIEAIALQTITA